MLLLFFSKRSFVKRNIILNICLILIIATVCTACAAGQTSKKEITPAGTGYNYYPDDFYYKKHIYIGYGKVLKDVSYYSRTAGENKTMNILLPAGYDSKKTYPVLYVYHGFHGSPADHISEYSYLRKLYGNLLFKKETVPMLIVSVDMYTAKRAEKEGKSQAELFKIYGKVAEDIVLDVIPYVESHYSVKPGRENRAVAGVSEGGSKALCTAFQHPDMFSYIGAFAPDPGFVPTPYYHGTFWENAMFGTLPVPAAENMPRYLYMAVGSKDPWNVGVTMDYKKQFDKAGIPNHTDLVEGFEHELDFWQPCFYNFLKSCFR